MVIDDSDDDFDIEDNVLDVEDQGMWLSMILILILKIMS